MLRVMICIALLCTVVVFAVPRTEVIKVIRVDTITQYDTIKLLRYDTLKITKSLRDTSILLKQDTAITSSKPIRIQKK